ncbi:MAG: hypothetical protein ACKOJF_07850, partial [Planctomycetaceae bacterium]
MADSSEDPVVAAVGGVRKSGSMAGASAGSAMISTTSLANDGRGLVAGATGSLDVGWSSRGGVGTAVGSDCVAAGVS